MPLDISLSNLFVFLQIYRVKAAMKLTINHISFEIAQYLSLPFATKMLHTPTTLTSLFLSVFSPPFYLFFAYRQFKCDKQKWLNSRQWKDSKL